MADFSGCVMWISCTAASAVPGVLCERPARVLDGIGVAESVAARARIHRCRTKPENSGHPHGPARDLGRPRVEAVDVDRPAVNAQQGASRARARGAGQNDLLVNVSGGIERHEKMICSGMNFALATPYTTRSKSS